MCVSPEKRTLMFRIGKEEDMQAQHITGGWGATAKFAAAIRRRSGQPRASPGGGSVRLLQRLWAGMLSRAVGTMTMGHDRGWRGSGLMLAWGRDERAGCSLVAPGTRFNLDAKVMSR